MRTLLFIALLLFIGTPAHAATIFSEDYEVANKSDLAARGWYTGINQAERDGTQTISVENAPSGGPNPRGGKVLRLQYQGIHQFPSSDAYNDKITIGFSAQPDLYARYYRRADPIPPATQTGYGTSSAKQHYLKVNGTSPDGYPNGFTIFWFGSRSYELGAQNPNFNAYSNMASVSMADYRWYCVEYHWKMNTPNVANGVMEIWIDGVQTLGYYTMNFRDTAHANTAFTNIEVYRQGSDNMYRYEDDFVLATTRVGCSGSPPQPGDTTPPSPPTAFMVQ